MHLSLPDPIYAREYRREEKKGLEQPNPFLKSFRPTRAELFIWYDANSILTTDRLAIICQSYQHSARVTWFYRPIFR